MRRMNVIRTPRRMFSSLASPRRLFRRTWPSFLGSAEAHGVFEGAAWDRYSLGDGHVRVGLVQGSDVVKTLTLFREGSFR